MRTELAKEDLGFEYAHKHVRADIGLDTSDIVMTLVAGSILFVLCACVASCNHVMKCNVM